MTLSRGRTAASSIRYPPDILPIPVPHNINGIFALLTRLDSIKALFPHSLSSHKLFYEVRRGYADGGGGDGSCWSVHAHSILSLFKRVPPTKTTDTVHVYLWTDKKRIISRHRSPITL